MHCTSICSTIYKCITNTANSTGRALTRTISKALSLRTMHRKFYQRKYPLENYTCRYRYASEISHLMPTLARSPHNLSENPEQLSNFIQISTYIYKYIQIYSNIYIIKIFPYPGLRLSLSLALEIFFPFD